MQNPNPIPWSLRFKAILIDYLWIILYIIIYVLIGVLINFFILSQPPNFTLSQMNWLSFMTTVLPVTLFMTIRDYHGGSPGKVRVGLKVYYENPSWLAALSRNVIKFLPWHFGHLQTLRAMYTQTYDGLAGLYFTLSMGLLFGLLAMAFFRQDKRHLGDFIAQTQVQLIESAL